jgi:hypothetical protein
MSVILFADVTDPNPCSERRTKYLEMRCFNGQVQFKDDAPLLPESLSRQS